MTYEVKRIATDPFDIMCGECQEHEIEWWEETTEEELRNDHGYMLSADLATPDRDKEWMAEAFGWKPTPERFEDWLSEAIADGYIRVVE